MSLADGHLERLAAAYGPGFKFHDENLLMLSWYVTRVIEGLRQRRAASLLSLGIGHRVVSRALFGLVGVVLMGFAFLELWSAVLHRGGEALSARAAIAIESLGMVAVALVPSEAEGAAEEIRKILERVET